MGCPVLSVCCPELSAEREVTRPCAQSVENQYILNRVIRRVTEFVLFLLQRFSPNFILRKSSEYFSNYQYFAKNFFQSGTHLSAHFAHWSKLYLLPCYYYMLHNYIFIIRFASFLHALKTMRMQ